MDILVLLEKLTTALTYKHPGKFAPSVLISRHESGEYYVAIHTYDDKCKKTKMVSRTSDDLLSALEDVTGEFLASPDATSKNPLDELENFYNGDYFDYSGLPGQD